VRDGEPNKGGPPPMPHPLMEALRSTPEEILQYGALPAQERRERLFEHRRERVLQVLRESKKVDEALLEEWSKLSEAELFKALRKQNQRSNERRGSMRDGPGGPQPGRQDHEGPPPDDRFGPSKGEHRGPPPGERGDAPPCDPPRGTVPGSITTSGAMS